MNPIIAFIKLIRLPNLLIIALTQYALRYGVMYPLLGISGFELQMSDLFFFMLVLSTVMIAAAGYIINDYFDIKIDRVNRPDKIIVGKHIRRRVAMGAHIVINSIALLIAFYLAYRMNNLKLVGIQIISSGALWYYSISFKKRVLLGNVVVAVLAALVPFVVGLYEIILQNVNAQESVNNLMFFVEQGVTFNDVMSSLIFNLKILFVIIIGFSVFAFLSTMIREIIKDIEDYEGDKKYASNTLPVVYGKKTARNVAMVIGLLMVVIIGYVQYYLLMSYKDMLSLMYLLFTIQIPMLYVIYNLKKANIKEDYSRLSTYTKLIMLTGVLYALLLYYLLSQQ